MRRRARGFTLIELMVVVAVIGILAAIAVPKFANLIRKSKEGATKGQLGQIRSALSIYYADNEGLYPNGGAKQNSSTALTANLTPKYVSSVPAIETASYHAQSSRVYNHETSSQHNHDYGYWGYDGVTSPATDSDYGKLWIMCSHTDTKGSLWSEY